MARIFCGRGTGASRCTSASANCGSASRESLSSSGFQCAQFWISAFMSPGASGSARERSRRRSPMTSPTRSPSPASKVASFIALPDVDALVRRDVQLLARLHIERWIPGIDVADDAVDSELAWAVRIAHHLTLDEIVAHL